MKFFLFSFASSSTQKDKRLIWYILSYSSTHPSQSLFFLSHLQNHILNDIFSLILLDAFMYVRFRTSALKTQEIATFGSESWDFPRLLFFIFLRLFSLVPFNFLSRFSFPRHSIQIQLALIHPVVCAVCNAMLVCARMRHKKSARHSDFFEYIKLPLFYLQFHKTPHRLHLKNESLNFGWTWNVTQFIMQTYCHFIDIKK